MCLKKVLAINCTNIFSRVFITDRMKLLTGSELTALKYEFDKYAILIKEKDTVTEPFKSKYEALECLENMKV